MALLNVLWPKKPKPPRVHSRTSEFASISLASSSLVSPLSQVAGGGLGWWKKAWDFYDVVPEMRLVVSFRAAALSKVKLQIARLTEDGPELVTDARSKGMLDTLFGGIPNHSAALGRYAQHLTVIGDTYTFVVRGEDGEDEWLIVPADHVNFNGERVRFKHPITGEDQSYNVNDLYNFRLWQPHPHHFWEADSPTRGGISALDKIQAIDANIKTIAMSRLVGGGIFPWPVEANLPAPSAEQAEQTPLDAFQRRLVEAMTASISDPNSAGRHAPIFVSMPAETIASLREPINFWSEFDDNSAGLRDAEIRRYAAGQPMPTEMITGVGDINHWTGWQLSEEDLKFDISPLAQTICDALTERVVHPVLGTEFVVQPDFSELVTRPNRTPEAIELRAAGAITINELRETAGYPHVDGGDRLAGLETGQPLLEIEAERTLPELPDREAEQAFAVAHLIARDVVWTAGQWLATHSGRSVRGQLSEVDALSRHCVQPADGAVLEQAVSRVRPKYEGVVEDSTFSQVVSYVKHIFSVREQFSADGLREWVSDGH